MENGNDSWGGARGARGLTIGQQQGNPNGGRRMSTPGQWRQMAS